jgi:hypothetical protein
VEYKTNFVPAIKDAPPQLVEVETWRELPSAPITPPMPHSGHVDRAKGFTIVTAPLAAATGFVVLLIGISAFGVPLLSVAALLLALGGFSLVWLIAYVAHTLISPDGALFVHVLMGWGYLRREQTERIRRYRKGVRCE